MAFDGKIYNCKVLRLVEMDDFDINNRPHLRSYVKVIGKIVRCSNVGRIIRAGVRIIRVIGAPRFQKVGTEAG